MHGMIFVAIRVDAAIIVVLLLSVFFPTDGGDDEGRLT